MAKDAIDLTATDGDHDGLVQDGTKNERPVAPAGFVAALDGDNYLTIAERLGAKDPLAEAKRLFALNFEQVVYPGMLVKVNGDA